MTSTCTTSALLSAGALGQGENRRLVPTRWSITAVDDTAGAYYAARLGVLEYLAEINRQAKVLILREVSDDYCAPVGVWQIRESVRSAFDGGPGDAETLMAAVTEILPELRISMVDLRRKSHLVSGLQSNLSDFATTS